MASVLQLLVLVLKLVLKDLLTTKDKNHAGTGRIGADSLNHSYCLPFGWIDGGATT